MSTSGEALLSSWNMHMALYLRYQTRTKWCSPGSWTLICVLEPCKLFQCTTSRLLEPDFSCAPSARGAQPCCQTPSSAAMLETLLCSCIGPEADHSSQLWPSRSSSRPLALCAADHRSSPCPQLLELLHQLSGLRGIWHLSWRGATGWQGIVDANWLKPV